MSFSKIVVFIIVCIVVGILLLLPSLGESIVDGILWVAGLLTSKSAPGLMSLVLVLGLVACWFLHGWESGNILAAIEAARSILKTVDPHFKKGHFIGIDPAFKQMGTTAKDNKQEPQTDVYGRLVTFWSKFKETIDYSKQKNKIYGRLGTAWREFGETIVFPEQDDDQKVYNTVRPFTFFAREELGLEHGIWRQIPAAFVTVGLFLTFLGLVAALEQTSVILANTTTDPNLTSTDGLKTLLSVASAKFIMSLTGLLCSIILSFRLRWNTQKIDQALHDLCADIEHGCTYLSEQQQLGELLQQAAKQTAQLESFSTELVAQIAKPLKKEVPKAITKAIQRVMQPMIDGIQNNTGKGIETLTKKVGDQLAGSVEQSATSMTTAMATITSTMTTVATRLDQSASTMNGQMGAAVQALSDQIGALEKAMSESSKVAMNTLNQGADRLLQQIGDATQKLGDSTGKGAQAIEQAGQDMADKAKKLTQNIDQATTEATAAHLANILAASSDAAARIATTTDAMQQQIIEPIKTLTQQIHSLGSQIEAATRRVQEYSDTVEGSASAVELANNGLTYSTNTLTKATTPVRDLVGGIKTATEVMGKQTEMMAKQVAEASTAMQSNVQEMTRSTVAIVRETHQSIAASQRTVEKSLHALNSAVENFQRIIEKCDVIDKQLGNAFDQIKTGVQETTNKISDFTAKQNEEFTNALSRLEAVIAQTKQFIPRQDN